MLYQEPDPILGGEKGSLTLMNLAGGALSGSTNSWTSEVGSTCQFLPTGHKLSGCIPTDNFRLFGG